MGGEWALNWTVFGLSLALAHLLAWALNLLIHHLDQEQDGFTWLLVVAGVGGTLILSLTTVPWPYVLVIFAYFAASGTPMVVGSVYRTVRARREARLAALGDARRISREVLDDQTEKAAIRGERAAG